MRRDLGFDLRLIDDQGRRKVAVAGVLGPSLMRRGGLADERKRYDQGFYSPGPSRSGRDDIQMDVDNTHSGRT
ncbi:hypothetical protein [Beijerinckia sp. L45]|uniref:hypothetical protein n=1 Tax=Beijerinckia sp. L45 TaxID=1641855 RepID=UPI00131E7B82|nr:hypothetical protein [Beijerinckia sp. L45]